ncbi:hypothetical protein FQR65_LT16035 [Abscondita terminalis]|nr:hypothetical protein FQR65_LT16035 [Abscondita terminalis]
MSGFALVQFFIDKVFYVASSKNIKKSKKNGTIVKWTDGKYYAAKMILPHDNKQLLLDLVKSITFNSPTIVLSPTNTDLLKSAVVPTAFSNSNIYENIEVVEVQEDINCTSVFENTSDVLSNLNITEILDNFNVESRENFNISDILQICNDGHDNLDVTDKNDSYVFSNSNLNEVLEDLHTIAVQENSNINLVNNWTNLSEVVEDLIVTDVHKNTNITNKFLNNNTSSVLVVPNDSVQNGNLNISVVRNATEDIDQSGSTNECDIIPSTSLNDLNNDREQVTKTLQSKFPINTNNVTNTLTVPITTGRSSRHFFCIFCKHHYSRFAQHLKVSHKDEPEVKIILSYPPGSKFRKGLIETIRKRGDFIHNTSKTYRVSLRDRSLEVYRVGEDISI